MKKHLYYFILILTYLFCLPTYADDFDLLIKKTLDSNHRSTTNKARDKYRNPQATLNFFGLTANSNVMEISPGKGWYSEIIAPLVKEKGTFYSVIYDTKKNTKSSPYFKRLNKQYILMLDMRPDLFKKINIIKIDREDPKSDMKGKTDLVLTFRNVHNWAKAKTVTKMFRFFFDSLKTGGVLGVVEHRAKEGTPLKTQIQSGYMTEKYVQNLAEEAGFKYTSSSNVNNNPQDIKNYPGGVWTLLPNLRGVGEIEKNKYSKIGESDRMTLKFTKP